MDKHYFYSPFGEALVSEQAANAGWSTPYLFNAKEVDGETGLHYYGARYYDSKLGVWLSVDPLVGNNPHLTPFNFVSNNPIMRIDPDGRRDWKLSLKGFFTEAGNTMYARNSSGEVRTISSANEKANGEVLVDRIVSESGSFIYVESEGMYPVFNIVNESNGEKAEFMKFTNVDDAESLFKFGANNTKVEWAFGESKKDKNGNSIAFVGSNEGGHSWLVSKFEELLGNDAYHVSHSHNSGIKGASDADLRNASSLSNFTGIRSIYDVVSGYLTFDGFTRHSHELGGSRYNDNSLGHNRPRQ